MTDDERAELELEIEAVRMSKWSEIFKWFMIAVLWVSLAVCMAAIVEIRERCEILKQQLSDVIRERNDCQAAMKARDEK